MLSLSVTSEGLLTVDFPSLLIVVWRLASVKHHLCAPADTMDIARPVDRIRNRHDREY
jgi:hypothetical protein